MPNAMQAAGAQPPKPTKSAPLYTGRYFNGLYTNRSPLRDARTTRTQEKFYGPDGDAMIAGSNVEVTNRLTLSRRPGNPVYDTVNTWDNILSFDEFRISKALSDIFGTVTEQIDVMVSEGPTGSSNASLSAINAAFTKQAGDPTSSPAVWESNSPSAGQSYGKQVANQWYFGDGVDNKKWNQSLFKRTPASNSMSLPLNSYPFMSTYLIDGNSNLEQLIGAIAQSSNQVPTPTLSNIYITNVVIANNVITLTVNAAPYAATLAASPQPGAQFMIWSIDTSGQFGPTGNLAFLQGATITLTETWSSTTISATFVHPDIAETITAGDNTAFIQIENGGADTVTNTLLLGASVPTWGTTVPSTATNFQGSITIDGQAIWTNRGNTVQNWGFVAPDEPLTVSTFGATAGSWAPNTYYSPAGVYFDPSTGYLWQITTSGTTGTGSWAAGTPTLVQKKLDIYTITLDGVVGGVGKVVFGTETYPVGLTTGDTFVVHRLRVAQDLVLNGLTFTILSVSASSAPGSPATITATCPTLTVAAAAIVGDAGYMTLESVAAVPVSTYGPNSVTGTTVWTAIENPAQLTWTPNTHFYEDDYIIQSSNVFQLYKGVQPFVHSLYPIPGGSTCPNLPSGFTSPTMPVTAYGFDNANTGISGKGFDFFQGYFPIAFPAPAPTSNPISPNAMSLWQQTGASMTQPTAVLPIGFDGSGGDIYFYAVSGNGTLQASPSNSGYAGDNGIVFVASVYVPAPGTYTFSISHDDGAFFGFFNATGSGPNPTNNAGTGASCVLNIPLANLVGNNHSVDGGGEGSPPQSGVLTEHGTFTFPTAGNYTIEIDYVNWENQAAMILTCNGSWTVIPLGQNIAVGQDLSWTSAPAWPTGSSIQTTGQSYAAGPATASTPFAGEIVFGARVAEASNLYTWMNLGPVSSFVFVSSTPYTLPGTGIVVNGSTFLPYGTGVSSASIPTSNFAAASTVGSLAQDGATLWWINTGSSPSQTNTPGKISATSNQGFVYGIALVNTIDNTVSNMSPTNEVNGVGIQVIGGVIVFAPGEGLDVTTIDPQADYVAIYRTTDGGSIELLVPSNGNTIWTVPLVQYLQYGYVDDTPDTLLDELVQGAAAQENTPPLPGAVNLTYHLNRLWYSIGNTVYYTSGPNSPSGNGINGTAPSNTDVMISRVTRLVPVSQGLLVFTLSDVYIIPDNNGTILVGRPYLPGVGLPSYNALDINGTLIGLFSTDHQFLIFNPANGADHVGHPIADQFRLDNGTPGQDWNPSSVYVAWYTNGEDMGWYVSDGLNGWYRLVATPAPEQGLAWSPFATILPGTGQGCGAIKGVEVSPGNHLLLTGPAPSGGTSGSGSILARNLDASTDGGTSLVNGATYAAYAVFGSYVCAQPGQVANIQFITTDSVKTGTPLIIGVLLDEALPYYSGSMHILKRWETDPPNLKPSNSLYGQRFYLSEDPEESESVRHLQVMVQWSAESAINELLSFTIFGSFNPED
jgi:hypothetical protein